jgi:hypothetical protein
VFITADERIPILQPDRGPGVRHIGAGPNRRHGFAVILHHLGHVHVRNEQGAGFGHTAMPEHAMSVGADRRQVPNAHGAGRLVEEFCLGFFAVIDHEDLVAANRLGRMRLFIGPAAPDDFGILRHRGKGAWLNWWLA